LLSGQQASFNGTTGGWEGFGATVAWVSSPASSSSGALSATSTGTKAPSVQSGTPQTGGLVTARPGWVYEATFTLQAQSSTLPVDPAILFYDSSGTLLDYVFGQQGHIPVGQWTTTAPVLAVAPPNTASVAIGFVFESSSAGSTIFLERPVLLAAQGGGTAVSGPLHTFGNQVLDGRGNPLELRGVNMPGLQSSSHPPVLNAHSVVQAQEWGANFVRIPVGEQLWLTSSCDYDPNYTPAVDQMVGWVTSLGMVALLDLDYSAPGTQCAAGDHHAMADDPGSVQFWQQVAARYQSNPLVAFDLYNEPENISSSVWLNGGPVSDQSGLTYQAAGMQQLYDAVRSTGATNLVFVSGLNWANTPPTQLVQGTNIVYAVHAYTCPVPWAYPPQCTTPDAYDPSRILDRWLPLAQNQPVAVTEFGWPTPFDETYMANVVAFAQGEGWGWSAFAWSDNTTSAWTLLAQDPSAGVFEPSPSGMPILAALTSLPGS
jgi:hypothetical protein